MIGKSQMNKRYIFIFSFIVLFLSQTTAQTGDSQEPYWIYTATDELINYQINAIDDDELVVNNGNWDVKISIADIELIALPPKPALFGQLLGGGVGGYCGLVVGAIPGFFIWIIAGGTTGPGGPDGSIVLATGLVGVGAGIYYGRKLGGKYFKGKPEIIVDFSFWSLEEKKAFIQTNLIQ